MSMDSGPLYLGKVNEKMNAGADMSPRKMIPLRKEGRHECRKGKKTP